MTDIDASIIIYIASIVMAFYCGMKYAEHRLIKKMIDMMTPDELDELDQLAEKIKSDLESKGIKGVAVHQVDEEDVVEVKHEVVDGRHFLYKNGNIFMCQGNTFETAAEQFANMIKQHEVGVITHHDGGTSLIIENKLKGGGEVKTAN